MPKHRARRVVAAFAVLLVSACAVLSVRTLMDSGRIRVTSVGELAEYFEESHYGRKEFLRPGAQVPGLLIGDVPSGWASQLTVDMKKSIFFRSLLPMVLLVNREIRADRERLHELGERISGGEAISRRDIDWLISLASRYGLRDEYAGSGTASGVIISRLQRRVDVIPPSLALAQAAVESAYGSSRFATEGNALFGQWRMGDGIVPEDQRTELGDYRIARFASPVASVRAYARNLNTHPAYREFRTLRANARQRGTGLHGRELAEGLTAYSEKGADYVSLLQSLIAFNGLGTTDSARLLDGPMRRIATGWL